MRVVGRIVLALSLVIFAACGDSGKEESRIVVSADIPTSSTTTTTIPPTTTTTTTSTTTSTTTTTVHIVIIPKPEQPKVVSQSLYSDASAFLACTRAHESDTAGGYQAVSPDGTYRGAYQFLQSTWDNTARHAGRYELIGVDPAAASPADQDAMATHLYHWQGKAPWGYRC